MIILRTDRATRQTTEHPLTELRIPRREQRQQVVKELERKGRSLASGNFVYEVKK